MVQKTVLALLYCSLLLMAAGPSKLAKSDRTLWPYEINTPGAFDFASQMEMLAFIRVLESKSALQTEAQYKELLGLKGVNLNSIAKWKQGVQELLTSNVNNCRHEDPKNFLKIAKPATWKELARKAKALDTAIPANLKPWLANSEAFYETYIYEQMRLAALFPKISSEILTMDPSEVQGNTYKDKSFLLTFDDGPTVPKGNTDKLIVVLREQHMPGYFFVLGRSFETRLNRSTPQQMQTLYKGMLVGSHGYEHQAHPGYESWKFSLDKTNGLIQKGMGYSNRHFRPPYGQRNQAIVNHLKKGNAAVMLWNIDSQDWSSKISDVEVAHRVTTLMLLWRRGVLLFHDVHPKAATALPQVAQFFKGSGITWIDPNK